MTTDQYIDHISERYKAGIATEQTFRGDGLLGYNEKIPPCGRNDCPPWV